MTSWLGIAIFLLFSASVSLFSQLERKRFQRPHLPETLGVWQEDTEGPQRPTATRERRYLVANGGLLRRTRLIEQVRYRDAASGTILDVLPERVVHAWFDFG